MEAGRRALNGRRGGWLGLVGTALIIVACNARQHSDAPTAGASAATAAITNVSAWAAGNRYLYATHLNSKLVLGGQGMMGFDLNAKLLLETRQVGADTEFIARLTQSNFKAESPDTQQQFVALARELEEPFGFSTQHGKLSALRLPPKWSRFAVSISRTIAAAFQLVPRPVQEKGENWIASEVDATGHYDAEYAPMWGDPTLLSKHKLRYGSISLGKITLGQFGAQVAPQVVESKGKVRLGDGPGAPQLALVEYSERLKVQLTPTSLVDSETALKLTYEGPDPARTPLDWGALSINTKSLGPDEVPAAPTAGPNYDAERIGDYTFTKALAELEAQARDPQHNQLLKTVRGQPYEPDQLREREAKLQQQGRAFTALAALLRTDKKNIPLAVARVRARSPALRGLLDALASAGTPEAQAALVSVMNDTKLGLPLQRAAAGSLSRTERASAESVLALEAHVSVGDALHVYALYGLGTIARRLRGAGEIARADDIARGLAATLTKVSAPADQVDVLRAIANSGAASAFDAVRPYLEAKAGNVRVAAVDALRLMQRPEVDGIIVERLGQPDAQLQDAALDAISVRTPSSTLVGALEKAATSGVRPALRLKAVRIMGQWLPQRPDLRPMLERLATDDVLEQIRTAAKAALAS